MVNIEERLTLVRYNVDVEPHIRVDTHMCKDCRSRDCTFVCPAGCYTLSEDGELTFAYSGCLECGSCHVACEKDAIEWNYPRGGFGVCFRFS